MGNEILKTIWVMSAKELQEQRDWIEERIIELGQDKLEVLVMSALQAKANAYVEYSAYEVGGSVLCVSGAFYGAANAEKVTFSGTLHGEGSAVKRAIDGGEHKKSGRRFVEAVAVLHKGASGDDWSGPCGECLQHIVEHCDNALILVADEDGEILHTTSLRMLMTRPFTPTHLGIE